TAVTTPGPARQSVIAIWLTASPSASPRLVSEPSGLTSQTMTLKLPDPSRTAVTTRFGARRVAAMMSTAPTLAWWRGVITTRGIVPIARRFRANVQPDDRSPQRACLPYASCLFGGQASVVSYSWFGVAPARHSNLRSDDSGSKKEWDRLSGSIHCPIAQTVGKVRKALWLSAPDLELALARYRRHRVLLTPRGLMPI